MVMLPLLAYACCGWVFFEGVQAATATVVISPPHTLLLVASGGGGDGDVPVIVAVGLLSCGGWLIMGFPLCSQLASVQRGRRWW